MTECYTLLDWESEHAHSLGVWGWTDHFDDLFPPEPLLVPGNPLSEEGNVWFAQMTQVLAAWLLDGMDVPLILMDYEDDAKVGFRLAKRDSRKDVIDVLWSFWNQAVSTRGAALAKARVGSSDLMRMQLPADILKTAVAELAAAVAIVAARPVAVTASRV